MKTQIKIEDIKLRFLLVALNSSWNLRCESSRLPNATVDQKTSRSQSLYLRCWLQAFEKCECVYVCMYLHLYIHMYVFALCLRDSYTFTFRFSLPYCVFKWGRNVTDREKGSFYQTSVVWKMGHLVKSSLIIEGERKAAAENRVPSFCTQYRASPGQLGQ